MQRAAPRGRARRGARSPAAPSAPTTRGPSAPVPATYKEAPSAGGATWLPAAPADALDRGDWWRLFGDPELDRLAAAGRRRQPERRRRGRRVRAGARRSCARRARRSSRRSSLVGSARRSGGGGARQRLVVGQRVRGLARRRLGARLLGPRRPLRSRARAPARRRAPPTSPRRACRRRASWRSTTSRCARPTPRSSCCARTIEGYERALQITQNRYAAGVVAKTDVLQAQTQLATTRADLATVRANRARFEHAIAVLIGKAPGDVSIAVAAVERRSCPAVPLGVPSELLQRRPDIAAAERQVAAANAQIGIERSAYFPSLTLGASLGNARLARRRPVQRLERALVARRLGRADASSTPARRAARVAGAEAARDAAVARYRQTVLTAFQGVEDQLATRARWPSRPSCAGRPRTPPTRPSSRSSTATAPASSATPRSSPRRRRRCRRGARWCRSRSTGR